MKRVTATDARRNWFRLLDEVAAGETVVIERGDRRILICREEATGEAEVADYSSILRAPGVERADEWGWEWSGEEGEVSLKASD